MALSVAARCACCRAGDGAIRHHIGSNTDMYVVGIWLVQTLVVAQSLQVTGDEPSSSDRLVSKCEALRTSPSGHACKIVILMFHCSCLALAMFVHNLADQGGLLYP